MFIEIAPENIKYNVNTYKMSYKEIICDENIRTDEIDYLRKMHHLRYNVFVKRLKWDYGIETYNEMEFDEFDDDQCWHLIHINEDDDVDIAMRFLKTEKQYLLGDKYNHFVQFTDVPRHKKIFEITRFAVDNSKDKDVFPKGIAAMINWGIEHDLDNLVSLTRVGMLRALKQIGWDPTPLGEPQNTPNDISIALQYTVNKEMLRSVCTKNGIDYRSVEITPQPV